MAFDYGNTAATADRLLKRFGAAATLRRVIGDNPAYDPATGAAATPAETVTACTAAVFDYPAKFIDGTMIRQGDKQALVSPIGVALPTAGDRLQLVAGTYIVVAVKDLAPAGVSVLYDLQVRTP